MFGKKENWHDSLYNHYKDSSEEELKKITVDNGYTEEAEEVALEILNSGREEYNERLRIEKEHEEAISNHKFTTSFNFEGYEIVEYLGLVSGESVIGTGYFSDIKAGLSDLFGAESIAYSDKMKTAKQVALYDMLRDSVAKGCNATISISFDYITFSGNMIGVSVNGTAVKIKKCEV